MAAHDPLLQELFKGILGTEVSIKDNLDANEEIAFKLFIERLELAYNTENKIFEEGGIELTKVTDHLWFVVESCFRTIYGEDATDMIIWYIYDRFNPDGSIVPLEGPGDKLFIIKDPSDLWSYIKYKLHK